MYEKKFQRIIKASQNRSLSFFVGAGVSSLSGAPSWKELIKKICKKIDEPVKENYSSDEYLRIPQIFYHSINQNKDEYYKFIEENLNQKELLPNEVHKELLSFNPVSFITTNFDELLENAAIQYCQSFISIACDNEVANINGDKYILKLHGDLKHKNIVFKEEDYLNYSENFKLIETLLKSIFSTNTVVFIGYGLNDYNIKLILNWSKSLLKDNFNQPIFIYTDDSPLSEAELLYHKSRGLSVIDCTQITETGQEYLPRYMAVLNAIKKSTDLSLNGKTKFEAFEILYQILKPLDKLQALRIKDVTKKLNDYVIIDESGQIFANLDNNSRTIIQYFYEINSMPSSEYDELDENIKIKYNTILSVFEKAQIHYVHWGNKIKRFTKKIMFSDINCIHFDYTSMREIISNTTDTNEERYRKAFYLSRLNRYDESYDLFAEIAREAFKSKDYLLYYLCKVNCTNLNKVIKSVDKRHLIIETSEKIFENLPIEFQNEYANLKDLCSVNLLYKYSYDAFVDGLKLQKVIETNSVELGLTSAQKVTNQINDYLHFLLGNGIISDIFLEYKNTVQNLMALLVYKYSEQQKKIIHELPFPSDWQDRVVFDDIDFYCFIEYFTADEIFNLFLKNNIETISFNQEKTIEMVIHNIISEYEYLLNHNASNIQIISYETKIKTLLMLLRYMDISQASVDYICDFILKYEFRQIFISDKILFLDKQIAKRKMQSEVTSKLIEEKFLQYIDMHINSLESGSTFSLMSRNHINYYNLVHYICPQSERKSIHSLSIRVSHIMKKNLKDLFPSIVNHYWRYLSEYMKRKICNQVKKQLKNNFDFNLFKFLIWSNSKIDLELIELLKNYLYDTINKAISDDNKILGEMVKLSSPLKPYENLELVGYWCLLKNLPQNNFLEFTGISDIFDFNILYDKFDFTKFDISWLLNWNSNALEIISKNKQVKEKIRNCITSVLNTEQLSKYDESKITKILIKYFC